MGQYYKPYIENDDGVFTLYSHDYDNGLKLMEHSYLGNNFVNVAVTMIDINEEGKPSRIAWVGDYANDVGCEPSIYEACWRSDDYYDIKPDFNEYFWDKEKEESIGYGYYVNVDKNEYVDIAKFAEKVGRDSWGFIINPLPLLTAIGNGQGGGDYHSCYPYYDEVGRWAMDTIYFDTEMPSGIGQMTDITEEVLFKEERNA